MGFGESYLRNLRKKSYSHLSENDQAVILVIRAYNKAHRRLHGKDYYIGDLAKLKSRKPWKHFNRLRVFLKCLKIDPDEYMEAQFRFTTKTVIPYASGLCSATAVDKYRSLVEALGREYYLTADRKNKDRKKASHLLSMDSSMHAHEILMESGGIRSRSDFRYLTGVMDPYYLALIHDNFVEFIPEGDESKSDELIIDAAVELSSGSYRSEEIHEWFDQHRRQIKRLMKSIR